MKAGRLRVLALERQISGIHLCQDASERDVDPLICPKPRDFLSNMLGFVIISTAHVQLDGVLARRMQKYRRAAALLI